MRQHPTFERDVKNLGKTKCRRIEADIAAFERLVLEERIPMVEYPGFKPKLIYKTRALSRDNPVGSSGAFRVILEQIEEEYVLIYIYMHNQQGTREQEVKAEIRRRLTTDY